MKRVVIAPKMATVGLGALTLFALGGVLIGGLMVVGAPALAKNAGGSAMNIRIGGIVLAAIAVYVLRFAFPQWRAIVTIHIDRNGWSLVDRLGRTTAIKHGTAVDLTVRCRRVFFSWGGVPRVQDVVDGDLHAGDLHRRLAPSGRPTYGRVLEQLGTGGHAPHKGETRRFTARA